MKTLIRRCNNGAKLIFILFCAVLYFAINPKEWSRHYEGE